MPNKLMACMLHATPVGVEQVCGVRASIGYTSHKPGSGKCLARYMSVGLLVGMTRIQQSKSKINSNKSVAVSI